MQGVHDKAKYVSSLYFPTVHSQHTPDEWKKRSYAHLSSLAKWVVVVATLTTKTARRKGVLPVWMRDGVIVAVVLKRSGERLNFL